MGVRRLLVATGIHAHAPTPFQFNLIGEPRVIFCKSAAGCVACGPYRTASVMSGMLYYSPSPPYAWASAPRSVSLRADSENTVVKTKVRPLYGTSYCHPSATGSRELSTLTYTVLAPSRIDASWNAFRKTATAGQPAGKWKRMSGADQQKTPS